MNTIQRMRPYRIVMYELEMEHIGYNIFLTDVNFRVGMPWYLSNKEFCDHVTYMTLISEIHNSRRRELRRRQTQSTPPTPPPPTPTPKHMLNASAA